MPDIPASAGSGGRVASWAFEGEARLVGREPDLDRIGAFLDGVAGTGGPLVLLGEPGVGKTALLAAATSRAGKAGMHVLAVAGVEYKAQLSFGGLGELLSAAAVTHPSAALRDVLAVVSGYRDGPAPEPEVIAGAVLSLVRQITCDRPTLLVVDDVQWLDPASAVVLGALAHRLPATGVGLLCTARPGAECAFDLDGLPVHDVAPLSESASEELLTDRFPALAPRVRRRLMAEAQGNPLALLELPVALTGPQRTASEALPERLPLGRRLESAFASRITGLPAATRYLLLLAALDGTGDLRVLWRAVAGRCSLKHLGPAERARLIRVDDPSGVRFRHALTRSAVVELSTSSQRRAAHRALAQAWSEVPERRAWHLSQAAVTPDEQVAAQLERVAAVAARCGDGAAAVAALLRAADLTAAGPERARRLAEAAYVGANITGDLRDVPRLLDHARSAAPGHASLAAAMAGSAYLLNGSGDIDTAHGLLSGAIAAQPEPYDPDDATLAEAMHTLLLVCFFGGRSDLWSRFDAAVAKYSAVPDLVATTRSTLADPARSGPAELARLDSAIAELAQERDPLRIVRVAMAGAYADRLGACAGPLHRVVSDGRRGDNIATAIDALFLLGNHMWLTGQWSDLRRTVREGLDLCDHYDYPMLACPGNFLLACVAAVSGDAGELRRLTDQMTQWAGPRRAHALRAYTAHAHSLYALGRGDFEEAYQFAKVVAPAGTLPAFVPHALWTVMDLVESAVRTGRRGQALDHAAAAREAGLPEISPRLAMLVRASTALAADDAEHPGFEQALDVDGAERWPFDQARIHLCRGEQLRRDKSPAQARSHLAAAAEAFERLGAKPWAVRANKELRACGGPARSAPRQRAGGLTPQQREIAALAAAGLTNKQIGEKLFLSPRTVSTHLYQLFPKLGVTSRAALRDALDQLR
ncbi:AAA family ATPase [Streptomycetaceae bacterium NBC_01309]